MDNQNGVGDLNLNPDLMTTQGSSPTLAPKTTSNSQTIDITPGKDEDLLAHVPKSVHIDQAITPFSAVVDITPSAETPSLDTQVSTIPTATPTETNPASVVQVTEPISVSSADTITGNPVQTLAQPEPVVTTTTTTAETIAPVVTPTEVATSPSAPRSGELVIDSSSPLFEDPDKVFLAK